jgi:hypothetical protein
VFFIIIKSQSLSEDTQDCKSSDTRGTSSLNIQMISNNTAVVADPLQKSDDAKTLYISLMQIYVLSLNEYSNAYTQ